MRVRLFGLNAALAFGLVLGLGGCFLEKAVVEQPPNTMSAEDCGTCHKNEFREWKKSPHAQAWVSETFRQQTDGYQTTKCLTCHRPDPIYGIEDPKKITARKENANEGVTCVTCHLTPESEIGGPHLVLPAHYVKSSDDYYLDSKQCGVCHQAHYQDWKKTEKSMVSKKLETCQDCHMPAVRRKLIVEQLFQYVHWENDTKKHTFEPQPDPISKAEPWFVATHRILPLHRDGLPIEVVIRHNLPHGVPAGIFGFKTVDMLVTLKTAEGLTVEQQHLVFHAENKKNMPIGQDYKKIFNFSKEVLVKAEYIEISLSRRNSRLHLGKQIFIQQTRL